MALNVTGIFLVVSILVILLIALFLGFYFRHQLKNCVNNQDSLCPQITCPCDDQQNGPCFGLAYRVVGTGVFLCSNSPTTAVDENGNVI